MLHIKGALRLTEITPPRHRRSHSQTTMNPHGIIVREVQGQGILEVPQRLRDESKTRRRDRSDSYRWRRYCLLATAVKLGHYRGSAHNPLLVAWTREGSYG